MKKKLLAMVLCAGLVVSVAAGCGGPKDTAESTDTKQEETAKEEEDEAEAEEASDEMTEYGITEAQLEALTESVKTAVTEEYLEKYNIPAAEFQMLPYSPEAFGREFDETGAAYGARDSYAFSNVWGVIEKIIIPSEMHAMYIMSESAGMDTMMKEKYLDMLPLEETADERAKAHEGAMEYDPFSFEGVPETEGWMQYHDLIRAIYKGIANFLREMEEQGCYQDVMHGLLTYYYDHAEEVEVETTMAGVQEPVVNSLMNMTTFDRVIVENIQFE